MNMNNTPTTVDLASILATADDSAGHHVLWVDRSGEVHLSVLDEGSGPNDLQAASPSMQLRYETFTQGNGYVGPEAAKDTNWLATTLRGLTDAWAIRSPGKVNYVA